jgi:hypothetical protein
VQVALGNKNGGFSAPTQWIGDFGTGGGWNNDLHPRFLMDINNDGYPDLVGFAGWGVLVALNNKNGGFSPRTVALKEFCNESSAGGWSGVSTHPRYLVDVNNDGYPDIVGFKDWEVWVALNNKNGGFNPSTKWISDFGRGAGWTTDLHVRHVVDINNDGYPDIVGFASWGVVVALNNKNGGFSAKTTVLKAFGNDADAGGWGTILRQPRYLADVNNDGYPDIVGISASAVMVALNNKMGGFNPATQWVGGFGSNGGWTNDLHPRFVIDINNDGYPDIVGLAGYGVVVALNNKNGGFSAGTVVLKDFGLDADCGGWGYTSKHPRYLADVNNDGYPDIVGFNNDGVVVALNNKNGGFNSSSRVLNTFGAGSGAGSWEATNPRRIG